MQLWHVNVIARELELSVNPLLIWQNALLKEPSNIYSRKFIFSQIAFVFLFHYYNILLPFNMIVFQILNKRVRQIILQQCMSWHRVTEGAIMICQTTTYLGTFETTDN